MRFCSPHAQRWCPNGEECCIACRLCGVMYPTVAINIESEEREGGTRRTKCYDIGLTKRTFCGFCKEAHPTDAIVEMHIFEYHGERKGDLHMTKPISLTIDDKYEVEIAKRKAADTSYH